MIYFDNAATTLIKPDSVSRAMEYAVRNLSSPGRGAYESAMRAAEKAYECREAAAKLFNVDSPEKIIFTSNATHALNIAIKSLARKGDRVVISGYEHNAVVRPLNTLGAKIDAAVSPLFDQDAALEAFDKKLTEGTKLAVVNNVSNVFGFVLPVEKISQICQSRGIPLIVDASQAAGSIKVDFVALNADFVAMPGHKGLYGPQGTGLLLCREPGKTLIEGGSGSESKLALMPDYLPDRQEAGTHNMPGIAGLLEGIRFVQSVGTEKIEKVENRLLCAAVSELKNMDEVVLYCAERNKYQSPVLSFTVEGSDCEEIAAMLSQKGVAVRAGMHCAPLAHKSAGTLSTGTVRLSLSVFNTMHEIKRFSKIMKEILFSLH